MFFHQLPFLLGFCFDGRTSKMHSKDAAFGAYTAVYVMIWPTMITMIITRFFSFFFFDTKEPALQACLDPQCKWQVVSDLNKYHNRITLKATPIHWKFSTYCIYFLSDFQRTLSEWIAGYSIYYPSSLKQREVLLPPPPSPHRRFTAE